MVRQDFGCRENTGKKRDGVFGVTGRFLETQRERDGKCADEVNEPGDRQHTDE